jgi:hypothetical protein
LTGRQTFPEDVYIPHLGSYQPFVGLHVNAFQGGHLPINGGLDAGGTRRGVGIITDRGGDTPLFQYPEVFEDPKVKRHPVLGHLLIGHAIGHVLQVGQRFGFLGADFPQLPEGVDRFVGDNLTAVIHMQVVLDFIGVFTALNDNNTSDIFERKG